MGQSSEGEMVRGRRKRRTQYKQRIEAEKGERKAEEKGKGRRKRRTATGPKGNYYLRCSHTLSRVSRG